MRPWRDSTEILGPAFAGPREKAGRGPDSVRLSGRSGLAIAVLLGLWLLSDFGTTATARARQAFAGDAADEIEFFEKSIRPVLAERCAECHGDRVEKPKGSLILGTREGMLKGGDSGPAIVPGDPDSSLLIRAIRYTDEALRMPPKGRLAAEEVAAFEAWVKRVAAPAPARPRRPDRSHWGPRPGAITGRSDPRASRPSPPGSPPRARSTHSSAAGSSDTACPPLHLPIGGPSSAA